MKNGLRTVAIGLALLGALLLPAVASAAIISGEHGTTADVPASQTINDDLYISGERVLIEGTVNGDVYAAGSTVTIKGTVNGSVFAAGQDVYVSGTVTGGVRLAGQNLRISDAAIAGGVSTFGQVITIERDAEIGGGLNFAGSAATIRGNVANSVMGAGASITLAGTLSKHAHFATEKLNLEKTAVINGNLQYASNEEFSKQKGALVKGDTKHVRSSDKKSDEGADVFMVLWGLTALYLVGAALLWLFPSIATGVADQVSLRTMPAFGWGLLALLLSAPVLIILMITIVGIPLALILIAGLTIALFLSHFWVALAIGNAIADRAKWQPNPYANAFMGLVVLTVIGLLPVFGGVFKVLAAILGFGGFILYIVKGTRKKTSIKNAKTT